MKLVWSVALVAGLASYGLAASSSGPKAPYWRPDETRLVENEYIVELVPSYTVAEHFEAIKIDLANEAPVFHEISSLPGYRARLDTNMLEEIRNDPGVKEVQHDTYIDIDVPKPAKKLERRLRMSEQKNAVFNLAQISSDKKLPKADTGEYRYVSGVGAGVIAFVLDTGINLRHEEFSGRAHNLWPKPDNPYCKGASWDDWGGHGTHVAGILVGKEYGIARHATVLNVPAICKDNSQTIGSLVQAVSDVVGVHKAHARPKGPPWFRGSVLNLSWSKDVILDDGGKLRRALHSAKKAGISIVSSAGNENRDASSQMPCMYKESVICVGAVNEYYRKSSFSNYGHAIDVLAPGSRILSADASSTAGVVPLSGTSQACPHVAGILATFLSAGHAINDMSSPRERLMANRVKGWVRGFRDHPHTTDGFATNGIAQGLPRGLPYVVPSSGNSGMKVAVDALSDDSDSVTTSIVHYNTTYTTRVATRTFEGTDLWDLPTPTAW